MSFAVLFVARKPLHSIGVCCQERFDSVVDPSHSKEAAKRWDTLLSTQKHLHNALKYRLAGIGTPGQLHLPLSRCEAMEPYDYPHTFTGLEDIIYTDEAPTLYLGLTDYRHLLTHEYSADSRSLLEKAERESHDAYSYLSNALGVEVILKSRDNHVILLKRSSHVSEDADLHGLIGGHAEPEHTIQKEHYRYPKCESDASQCFSDRIPPPIQQLLRDSENINVEIFDSIIREIHEEVNIPPEQCRPPVLIGLVANRLRYGKPDLVFVVECALVADEIVSLYREGGVDAFESTEIVCIPDDALATALHGKPTTTAAKACLFVYEAFSRIGRKPPQNV